MAEISKETQQEIAQLQSLQQQMQLFTLQRQRLEQDIIQIDAALEELGKASGKTYKAVGGFLVESAPKDLIKELNEQKETADKRVSTIKKQEERIKTKADEMQKKVEKELDKIAK